MEKEISALIPPIHSACPSRVTRYLKPFSILPALRAIYLR